jgi:glycosyltransferase involved in cell wall biosynthesis
MNRIGLAGTVSPWMSGGAAVHPAELMKALNQRFSFKVVTPQKGPPVPAADGITLRTVRAITYITTFSLLVTGVQFLSDVDLIHLHDPRLFGIKKVLRRPLVTTVHGYLTLEAMADYHTRPGMPRYEFYERILQSCVDTSDYLIAVDSRIAEWLRKEFSASQISVIPNGVDLLRFRPSGIAGGPVSLPGVPQNGPRILAAKHFAAKNGMEIAVRAMPTVLQTIPDARLILAGSGKLKARLQSLVAELGIDNNVSMPGQIPNESMPELIASCDLGVIPSMPVAGVEEATSILMLELMASGKPVIASAIGGLRETIRHGETGLLVEPGQARALGERIVSTLADPQLCARIGSNARRYVELHHSWHAVANQVADVYDRFLAS